MVNPLKKAARRQNSWYPACLFYSCWGTLPIKDSFCLYDFNPQTGLTGRLIWETTDSFMIIIIIFLNTHLRTLQGKTLSPLVLTSTTHASLGSVLAPLCGHDVSQNRRNAAGNNTRRIQQKTANLPKGYLLQAQNKRQWNRGNEIRILICLCPQS